MAAQDDLALLKQMYQRGEISDEQYDVLRRHVLWGTPLPELIEEPGAPPAGAAPPQGRGYEQPRSSEPPQRYEQPRAYEQPRSYEAPPSYEQPRAYEPRAYEPRAYEAPRAYDQPRAYEQAAGPDRRQVDEGPPTQSWAPPPDWSRPPDAPVRAAAAEDGDERDRPAPRRAPKLVAASTSMVLALALVAAGVWWFVFRDPGVPAPAYARTVCTSVRDWQQIVDTRGAALVRSIAQQDDRVAVRSAVKTYYTDLADRTGGLRTAITAAGVATVDGGEAYADALTAAVGGQATALRELAARAERLDTGSAAVFQISLQSLLTGAETAVSAVTAALARPDGGTPAALRLALSDEPACAPYVG